MSWGKEIKCEACRAFYLFHKEFIKFTYTRAQRLDSIYDIKIILKPFFGGKCKGFAI